MTTGMPTVKQSPDGNVALELLPPPSSHQQALPPETTVIYFALAASGVFSLLCFTLGRFYSILSSRARRLRRIHTGQQHYQADPETCPIRSSRTNIVGNTHMSDASPNHDVAYEKEAQNLWIEGLSSSPVRIGGLTAASVPDMEEQHSTESRGVSRTSTNWDSQFTVSYADDVSKGDNSHRPRSLKSSAGTISNHRSISAGRHGNTKRQGNGLFDGHHWGDNLTQDSPIEAQVGGQDGNALSEFDLGEHGDHDESLGTAMLSFSSPPPLMPPTLSSTVSTINQLQERRSNYAASLPAELDREFIHQPNPDYMASTTIPPASLQLVDDSTPETVVTTTVIPQRWSYTKRVPIGIPIPTRSNSSPLQTDRLGHGGPSSSKTFSPSSYPPSSPQLPPGPPGAHGQGSHDDAAGQEGELQLQGEIISAVDGAGHGWKRHTRVYGGGVCLACAALGKTHGGGGYYGPKVPLSERR